MGATQDMKANGVGRRRGGDAALTYAADRAVWLAACAIVADHEGLRMTDLSHVDGRGERAKAHERAGRKLSCYLAVIVGEVTQHGLSRVSGLDRATIRAHLAAVEEGRDGDALAEVTLRALEAELALRLARRALRAQLAARDQAEVDAMTPTPAEPSAIVDPRVVAAWRALERAEAARSAMKTWMETDWDAEAAEPTEAERAA